MNKSVLLALGVLLSSFAFGQDGEDSPKPPWRDVFASKYEPYRDFGHDWKLGTMFGIVPGEGLLLGAGPILYEFGFRAYPYVYRMELVAGGSIPSARFKAVYTLEMPRLMDPLGFQLYTHFSELEVKNFYGFGNDSFRDEEKEGEDFYRVLAREVKFLPAIAFPFSDVSSFVIGLSFKYFDFIRESDRFAANQSLPELRDTRSIVGAGLRFQVDTRDHPLMPHKGIHFTVEGGTFPYLFQDLIPFHKLGGEIRVFLGDTLWTDIVLAFRVGGEKIFGNFPLYEAAFLGGGGSLRGFLPERFAGDASAFGNAELRISLFRERLLIPTEVGIFVLADAGRVWREGNSRGPWHTNIGGGLWFAPLNRDIILSASGAHSVDGLLINGGFGFGF